MMIQLIHNINLGFYALNCIIFQQTVQVSHIFDRLKVIKKKYRPTDIYLFYISIDIISSPNKSVISFKDFCSMEELIENSTKRARWINETETGETLANIDDFFVRVRFCNINIHFVSLSLTFSCFLLVKKLLQFKTKFLKCL